MTAISDETISYKPRTKLGKKLWELRLRMAASGARLLDWDDIEQEIGLTVSDRGGLSYDDDI